MARLVHAKVTPYNAQVELRDEEAGDYPQWETGDEVAVALPDCVAVATHDDMAGSVLVEVWQGEFNPDSPDLEQPVFESEFETNSDTVMAGNTVGNEFYSASLPAGRYRLSVFVSPSDRPPAEVYFVLGHKE